MWLPEVQIFFQSIPTLCTVLSFFLSGKQQKSNKTRFRFNRNEEGQPKQNKEHGAHLLHVPLQK